MHQAKLLRVMLILLAGSGLLLCGCEGDDDNNEAEILPPPAQNVNGAWNLTICDYEAGMLLEQDGNAVRGMGADASGVTLEIIGTLSGDDFSFTVIVDGDQNLVGSATVDGNSMSGLIAQEGSSCPFSATLE